MMARFLEIGERCTVFTDGTYRTYGTNRTRPISPMCPISPIREHATRCRASKNRAITPARTHAHTHSRSAEIRFPDQGIDSQAFGFVFQDHAAGF